MKYFDIIENITMLATLIVFIILMLVGLAVLSPLLGIYYIAIIFNNKKTITEEPIYAF